MDTFEKLMFEARGGWKSIEKLKECFIDLDSFMLKFNPEAQVSMSDLDEAIFEDSPTLEDIDIAYGEGSAEKWLCPQIEDFFYFAGEKSFTKEQIKNLASVISKEHKLFKVSQILHFFYRLKSGKYGDFATAISPMFISYSLILYRSQCNAREYFRLKDNLKKVYLIVKDQPNSKVYARVFRTQESAEKALQERDERTGEKLYPACHVIERIVE